MSAAPIQKALPRVSSLVHQVAGARSFLPAAFYKPLATSTPSSTSTTALSSSLSPHIHRHNFSTTTAKMTHDTMIFKDAIQHRRTIYQLQKKSTISDAKIKELLELAIKDVPSSFNSQSARIVALMHGDHDKFWNIVEGKLKPLVPAENWQGTADRVAGFRNAYATILFYEDQTVVKGLQEKMALYADKFPQWSEHTSAMHQYTLWTAFEAEGMGCNLQHYNPLPDKDVQEVWGVPKEWDLKAQLVIGMPAEGARENLPKKEVQQIEGKRLHVYGA